MTILCEEATLTVNQEAVFVDYLPLIIQQLSGGIGEQDQLCEFDAGLSGLPAGDVHLIGCVEGCIDQYGTGCIKE